MNTESVILALYCLGQIAGTMFLGMQVREIKSKLGNGSTKGVFPRRDEVELMIQEALKKDVQP